jgi:uncharacterized protein YcbX
MRNFPTALALAITMMLTTSVSKADQSRQLTPVQTQIANVEVANKAVDVRVWMDRSNVSYQPGERAKIFVRASADVYLHIVNVAADGTSTVLFPNEFTKHQGNFLRANTTLVLPNLSSYEFAVSGPSGANVLKIMTSSRPELFAPEQRSADAFPALRMSAEQLARRLMVVPQAQNKPDKNYQVRDFRFFVGAGAVSAPVAVVPGTSMTTTTTTTTTQAAVPAVALAPLPLNLATSLFDLRVETHRANYQVGDKVLVRVTPERRCRLTLLDVGVDGSYDILVPNTMQSEVWAEAGRTLVYPASDSKMEWRASAAGPRRLVALCGANPTLAQYFGVSARALAAKQPTLAEVLEGQPKGDSANAVFEFLVNPRQ